LLSGAKRKTPHIISRGRAKKNPTIGNTRPPIKPSSNTSGINNKPRVRLDIFSELQSICFMGYLPVYVSDASKIRLFHLIARVIESVGIF